MADLIGYARVSTREQKLDAQREALEAAGCSRIYSDTLGGQVAERPGLAAAIDYCRPGDSLVVWKLDRLGRSMGHLIELSKQLADQAIELRSITDGIDTGTTAGRFFFNVMAALASMERDLIVERTNAGLAAARKQGRVGGRRRKMTDAKIASARTLLASGTPPADVAAVMGVSRATLYRRLSPAAPITDT
jgi:DNA invertase Pin-like site-specific DNA recombinase